MRWVLRLVETEADSLGRGVDVMVISRSRDLGDIANLGLTLPEGKQLLARVQQVMVTAQAHGHVVLRPNCLSCGGGCHIKDWRLHQVATLFGTVAVRLPRFRCASCGHSTTCISWPSHCRSTPGLDQLRAHLSALMPYRVAAGVLTHLLPVDAGKSPETLRGHTLKIGERLREAPAVKPATAASAITVTRTTIGKRGRHGVGSSTDRLEAAADQCRDVRVGPRDSAEYLPATVGCLDVATAWAGQMPPPRGSGSNGTESAIQPSSSRAVIGLRNGRSSPRATVSGSVNAYRPSMSM